MEPVESLLVFVSVRISCYSQLWILHLVPENKRPCVQLSWYV